MLARKYIVTSYHIFSPTSNKFFLTLPKMGVLFGQVYLTAMKLPSAVKRIGKFNRSNFKIFEKFNKVKIATQYANVQIFNRCVNCVLLFTQKLFIDAEKFVCSPNKRFVWNFSFFYKPIPIL